MPNDIAYVAIDPAGLFVPNTLWRSRPVSEIAATHETGFGWDDLLPRGYRVIRVRIVDIDGPSHADRDRS